MTVKLVFSEIVRSQIDPKAQLEFETKKKAEYYITTKWGSAMFPHVKIVEVK